MPRGSTPKEERQYEHIKESYKKRGQGKRAEEIAARTVNKERAERGETKSSHGSGRSSGPSKGSSSKGSSSKPSASKPSASRRSSSRPSASRGSSSSSSRSRSDRTRQELYQEARKRGIEGRSSMNKEQLERALSR